MKSSQNSFRKNQFHWCYQIELNTDVVRHFSLIVLYIVLLKKCSLKINKIVLLIVKNFSNIKENSSCLYSYLLRSCFLFIC